jgi:acyl-CoA synthetase (AMP-forming)/AMP-acid ligase II
MKEMIIRIGDKIFPKEIEDFFMEHPDILEAQVKSIHKKRINSLYGTRYSWTAGSYSSRQDISFCLRTWDSESCSINPPLSTVQNEVYPDHI